jgi:enamine deaminase RidA (YjgF/YER057c/UK114 family)
MADVVARLAELGLTLPKAAIPLAAYVPARRSGQFVYTAGQLPFVDGELPMTGHVGRDVTPEQAHDLARISGLNILAAIATVVDLSEVVGVVKLVGFVASVPEFSGQPAVINGASELMKHVFGEAGVHARSAVGVTALPLNAPVEIEAIVEIASTA